MSIQTLTVFDYFMTIQNTVPANKQTVMTAQVLFDLNADDLVENLMSITEQAYNGLNQDAGDWCRECLNHAINFKFQR